MISLTRVSVLAPPFAAGVGVVPPTPARRTPHRVWPSATNTYIPDFLAPGGRAHLKRIHRINRENFVRLEQSIALKVERKYAKNNRLATILMLLDD